MKIRTLLIVGAAIAVLGLSAYGAFQLGSQFGYQNRTIDLALAESAKAYRSDHLRLLLEADDRLRRQDPEGAMQLLDDAIWGVIYSESIAVKESDAGAMVSICPHIDRLNVFQRDFGSRGRNETDPVIEVLSTRRLLSEAMEVLKRACGKD
jgi:hypothetical protein